jgi:cytochrome c556
MSSGQEELRNEISADMNAIWSRQAEFEKKMTDCPDIQVKAVKRVVQQQVQRLQDEVSSELQMTQ